MKTMSLKYAVQKLSDNHYVLPKVGSMKVEAHAFLSEALYQASEEPVWQQIASGASYEGVTGAYLMPDTHVGYGVPVGSVIVTDDTIIQGGSGYDISCGVLYMKAALTAGAVKGKYSRERWVREVERRIATGKGSHRPELMPRFSRRQADDILRFGARALGVRPELCERQYIPVPDGVDLTKIERAHAAVVPQLGSIGGGNHFVEMQVDRDSGEVYVMVHCGSRGYGWQTAEPLLLRGGEGAGSAQGPPRGLVAPGRRAPRPGVLGSPQLGGELRRREPPHHRRRHPRRHTGGVRRRRRGLLRDQPQPRAGGDPRLARRRDEEGLRPPQGSDAGVPCGAPGSGGYALGSDRSSVPHPRFDVRRRGDPVPLPGAYKSACSVNHGSGRLLARGEAKRKLEHKQQRIDDEMATVTRTFAGVPVEGIVGNHRHVPLDECAHVYKDLDEVLAVLEAEGIARVAHRLYPVANIKGTD